MLLSTYCAYLSAYFTYLLICVTYFLERLVSENIGVVPIKLSHLRRSGAITRLHDGNEHPSRRGRAMFHELERPSRTLLSVALAALRSYEGIT